MKQLLHTPEGFRDVFGDESESKLCLMDRIESLFDRYGFQFISPPLLEHMDVFDSERGDFDSSLLYKLLDRDGNTLVLRPDFTPSIARALSMYFMNENMPLRLCYKGEVFINASNYQGRMNESTEMGVEIINDPSPESEAEMLSLASDIMKHAGIDEFRITVSNTAFFDTIADEAGLSAEDRYALKELYISRNRFAATKLIDRLKTEEKYKIILSELPALFGGTDVLDRAAELAAGTGACSALDRLSDVYKILGEYGSTENVSFDLGLLSSHTYYTGLIFNVITYGSGDAVIKGGRYDRFIEKFGKKAYATGFTTHIDQILLAVQRQGGGINARKEKIMLTYRSGIRDIAVRTVNALRQEGHNVSLAPYDDEHTLDDHILHAVRHQFSTMICLGNEESDIYYLSENRTDSVNTEMLLRGILR